MFKEKRINNEQGSKINNFLELRNFLQEKLGDYFSLFATTLRTLSGIKSKFDLPGDKEEKRRIIKEALKATPTTPDNIKIC